MISNIILAIYAIVSTAGLVLLKLGGNKDGTPISFVDGKLALHIGAYAVLGFILYSLSFVIYTYLISKNDLGYIIPVSTALVYVGIFIASFILFKETFTALKIAGICLIFGGLVLLNINK